MAAPSRTVICARRAGSFEGADLASGAASHSDRQPIETRQIADVMDSRDEVPSNWQLLLVDGRSQR